MDFQQLMDVDCGQSNPISELAQHVTQNQTYQENVGNPLAPGLMQPHLMPPQSFRVDDLMREMEEVERQRLLMPTSVQNHYLPSTSQGVDQLPSENFHAKFEHSWDAINAPNYENKTNNFYFQGFPSRFLPPLNNLRVSQHFGENVHYQNKFQMSPQKQVECLDDFTEFKKIINDLDELEDVIEPEANSKAETELTEFVSADTFCKFLSKYVDQHCEQRSPESPQEQAGSWSDFTEFKKIINDLDELDDVVTPEENCAIRQEVHSKPDKIEKNEFANASEFRKFLLKYADQHCKKRPKPTYSKEELGQMIENTLILKSYSHIEDNPTIHKSTKQKKIKLDAPFTFQIMVLFGLQSRYSYLVCRSIFYWLKGNQLYNHLIPPNFTMENKEINSILKKDELDAVKSIYLKARQQNSANSDLRLQLMTAVLYLLTREVDKVNDCNDTASNSIEMSSEQSSYRLLNLGVTFFIAEKPYAALKMFFRVVQTNSQIKDLNNEAYSNIAMVYMYLKNYKEAIKYLQKALDPERWVEESNSNYKPNTLEDAYQLCLNLYLKCNKYF